MDAERLLDVVEALDPLADLPRTGWLLRGVRPCESIAEHCYGTAVVAMMLTDSMRAEGRAVDGERVIRMALLHDAPEAAIGDIPMPEKSRALDEVLGYTERSIAQRLLPPDLSALWQEVEDGATLEARVVKAADKIHMMVKALRYNGRGWSGLDDFWSKPSNFDDQGLPEVRAVFDAICARAGTTPPAR